MARLSRCLRSRSGQDDTVFGDVRIDTPQEILYYQNGGILQYVLRQFGGEESSIGVAWVPSGCSFLLSPQGYPLPRGVILGVKYLIQ